MHTAGDQLAAFHERLPKKWQKGPCLARAVQEGARLFWTMVAGPRKDWLLGARHCQLVNSSINVLHAIVVLSGKGRTTPALKDCRVLLELSFGRAISHVFSA